MDNPIFIEDGMKPVKFDANDYENDKHNSYSNNNNNDNNKKHNDNYNDILEDDPWELPELKSDEKTWQGLSHHLWTND